MIGRLILKDALIILFSVIIVFRNNFKLFPRFQLCCFCLFDCLFACLLACLFENGSSYVAPMGWEPAFKDDLFVTVPL